MDGKAVSAAVKDEVKKEVEELKTKGKVPSLAVVLVGNDPASKVYVGNKKKACEYCGIKSLEYLLEESTSEQELLGLIDVLNKEPTVNGILVQLPLPSHINEQHIINAINPYKDVDAFHPVNVGKIMTGNPDFLPCTPAGVMEIFKKYNIETAGKDCVIIGRSNIVGKPMSMLMLAADSTVTVCHSKTKDLKQKCKNADIIIAAVGRANFVTADMVKEGAVVIDVGINRTESGKLCGDVDFAEVSKKASYITPVPGGVGPMTIATLMKNTLSAFKIADKKKNFLKNRLTKQVLCDSIVALRNTRV